MSELNTKDLKKNTDVKHKIQNICPQPDFGLVRLKEKLTEYPMSVSQLPLWFCFCWQLM